MIVLALVALSGNIYGVGTTPYRLGGERKKIVDDHRWWVCVVCGAPPRGARANYFFIKMKK